MDSTDGDLSGSIVGGTYKIAKKIQSGYYGTTWLAHDTRSNGQVCLKTFFRENAAQRKELDILKKLCAGNFCHDNLCTILDVCSDRAPVSDWKGDAMGHVQYVVFEYCSGADLFNFLVTGPYERIKSVSGFPEPLARHYFTQALLAVMYLHERGVFHRDIKPENCVLDHNFNLKLTDFGTNKFLPASSCEPGQLLRASTKKVGTDSYRAPEVDSGEEYDPSAADVWSLGVTLFFMVAIEAMVLRARELDPYLKPLLAPLGIFFPFPFLCKMLDSYLKKDSEITAAMNQYNLTVSRLLPNRLFWDDWLVLKQSFSANLIDFFNCMFVLNPAHRVVLHDLANHDWLSTGVSITPAEIAEQMNNRSPRDIGHNIHASPSVRASKLLGGVDQAILRQTLSSRGGMATSCEYLSDSEVWQLTQPLRDIEALQVDMANSEDIQNLMIDINFVRQVLGDVLQQPQSERSRSVLYSEIPSSWVTQLFGKVGFLPHNRLLYLMKDRLDPALIGHTLEVIEGVEFAVSRDVIKISNIDLEEEEEEEEDVIVAMEEDEVDGNCATKISAQTTISQSSDAGSAEVGSYNSRSSAAVSADNGTVPHKFMRRRSSSEPVHSPTSRLPLGSMDQSSQDSWWTNGASLSTQSSQEELPEAMLDTPSSQELAQSHLVLDLKTKVDRHKPFQFKSAGEFCKMSGLLGSYGYYQVAIGGQLALYCRGNSSIFSARVVFLGNTQGSIGISSWCFQGHEEWQSILQRLSNDMQSNL